MFPCGQTVGHEWEDGGSIVGTTYNSALSSATSATTTPQQDFFYTVATTCGSEPGMAADGYYSTTRGDLQPRTAARAVGRAPRTCQDVSGTVE